MSLLDRFVPAWDAASRHSVQVLAEPSLVYEAARRPDLGRAPLVRLLMAIRSLPGRLLPARFSRETGNALQHAECTVGNLSFTLLAEAPGEEFVLGLMGRFWTASGGVVAATAEDFLRPAPPGLAQAFWNFRVIATAQGSELATETRVRCGDEASRRSFRRYWRIIGPASGAIRRSVLRQIRNEAERNAG